MKVTKTHYGTLSDGSKANLFVIENKQMKVCVTDFGCTLTGILLPNKQGSFDDVLLGYSTLDGFVNSPGLSFGTIVGRFANRIAKAQFSLNNNTYHLDANEKGINTLHGGFFRYDHLVWKSKIITNKHGTGVRFTRLSPNGEQGFPGNLNLSVTYTLNEQNQLTLKYSGTTDKDTPINLTNHAYFNLAGKGTVLNHELELFCDKYLETDENLIPTGKMINVKNTAFDFTNPKTVGKDIAETNCGYDDCFVTQAYNENSGLPMKNSKVVKVGILKEKETNRTMTVYTNQEGVQVYTGNYIGGIVGKMSTVYEKHGAICLETQCFPDTPNQKDFPSCILHANEKYNATTIYEFSL